MPLVGADVPNVIAPLPNALLAPLCKVPLFTNVPPLYELVLSNCQGFVPVLVTEVAAEPLLPITGLRKPFVTPVKIRPVATLGVRKPTVPVLLKVGGPVPEESMPPPGAPSENKRSVETVGPVYCRKPPLKTKLDAALLEAPMPLL